MFQLIRKFFIDSREIINELIFAPIVRLSFYQKCALLILAGLALYVPYINMFNANCDEQYTLILCRYSAVDIIKKIAIEDGHPPLSYLYSKFWTSFFINPEYDLLSLRIATLFVFFMTALLGVFPLKRLLGEKIALVWICLVFLMPSAYRLVSTIRMYPLAMFLITGTFIYGMLVVYKSKKNDLFLFALFSLLALYTHYYCVILCAVVWSIVFIELLRSKKYNELVPFLVAGTIVAVLYTPWLYVFYTQYQNMKELWFPNMQTAYSALSGMFFYYERIRDNYSCLCVCLGFLCQMLVLEYLIDIKENTTKHNIAKFALIVFWSIYIIALGLSYIFRPNLYVRYLVIPTGIFYVGLATGLCYLKKRYLVFIGMLAIIFLQEYKPLYNKMQANEYKQLQTYLQKEMPKNSLVLYHHTWGHLAMVYYGPNTDIYFVPSYKYSVLLQDEVKMEERHLARLAKYDNIYYLTSDQPSYRCERYFRSGYDGEPHCFMRISKQKALEYIKNTDDLRKELLFP